jgi:hypothetical protein
MTKTEAKNLNGLLNNYIHLITNNKKITINTRFNSATDTTGESVTAIITIPASRCSCGCDAEWEPQKTCQKSVAYNYAIDAKNNHICSVMALLKRMFSNIEIFNLEELPINKHPKRGYAFSAQTNIEIV